MTHSFEAEIAGRTLAIETGRLAAQAGGAVTIRYGERIPGAHLMGYRFEDESAVQPALQSEQAQRARQDWERWAEQVYELSVEIYAPLSPLPIFQNPN